MAGGWSATSNADASKASVEIYDVLANRWAAAGPLVAARAEFVMVRLLDGRLLAVAGVDRSYHLTDSAETYDPAIGTWHLTGKLAEAKMWPAAAVLPDGRVLLAGGATDVNANHRTVVCEMFAPQS